MALNDTVIPNLTPIEKRTSTPQLYTEGTLIDAMETAGRHFEDEELRAIMKETQGLGRIHLTEFGRLICQSYSSVKILSDAQTTALW